MRQGDPLSCLLFNIAIESLAQTLRHSGLSGLRTNDDVERIITTLFADDTTVYLAENDQFADLEVILRKWCEASGASFNILKTVVIPVGTLEYRNRLHLTRKSNPSDQAIPENIRIARDGELTRLLGAFVGNDVDSVSVWTPTLEAIDKDLKRWSRGNPSIEGRRLIINMVVGGRTQYLTRVQGMPRQVEDNLEKKIRDFTWNTDSTPTISLATLRLPLEEGGRKVLDIKIRNEAIELLKVQRYLKMDKDRPKWAGLADKIINLKMAKTHSRDATALITPLLQNTRIDTRAGEENLLPPLQRMLRIAKKYKVAFHTLILKQGLRREIPAWYHLDLASVKNVKIHSDRMKCLRINHNVRTTGDMEQVANGIDTTLNP